MTEGFEEVISDLVNPLAEWAITGNRPEYELDQIIEDGAVGVLTALIAQGGTKVVNKVGQGLKNQGYAYEGNDPGKEKTAPAKGTVSLTPYSQHEAENFLTGARNKVVGVGSDILEFVKKAISTKGGKERLYCGKLPQETVAMIFQNTGYDLSEFNFVISSDGAWHAYKHHWNDTERTKGKQISLRPENIARLPEVIAHPDKVYESADKDGQGRTALFFEKKIGNSVVAITGICSGRKVLDFDSMRIMQERSPNEGHADNTIDPPLTSTPSAGQTSLTDPIIRFPSDGVNMDQPQAGYGDVHYSLKDTAKTYEGKDLSKDGSLYGYEFLTSLPDMQVTSLPEVGTIQGKDGRINARTVVNLGMENARKVGVEKDGKVLVRNGYTGKQLCVTPNSIRHGLNGDFKRLLTNARLGTVIGEVIKNAVPINALKNKAEGVTGTYAMAGYAMDDRGREFIGIITVEQKTGIVESIEVYDTFHSVSGRQKKSGSQVDTKSQSIHSIKATTISIADLLETVKSTHQSILSEDVLSRLGEVRNPKGDYTDKVLFSIKDPETTTKAPSGETETENSRPLTKLDAKRFASETGTENGLVLDDYVQKRVRRETAERLNTLAQALGVRVRFVNSIRGGTANASIRGNEVQIERYNPNPVTFLLGHELTHRMQQLSPEAYARFKEAVRSEAEKEAQALRSLYRIRGENIDFEGAMDEATANYAGRLLEEGPVLDEFIQRHKTDRTLLEKVLDAVRDILSKLTGAERKKAETAEAKLLEALEETAEKVKKNGGAVAAADSGETKYSFKGYDAETGRGIYESNFPIGTPKTEKGKRILNFVQNVWSKAPLKLTIEEHGEKKTIYAQFDPTYSEDKKVKTDLSKLMGGNRHGTAMEKRVTLDLADDYYQIAQEASYNYSKKEVGKTSATHEGVTQWHYFINDILFQEFGSDERVPFRVTINVKEKPDGSYVYSYNAERQN